MNIRTDLIQRLVAVTNEIQECIARHREATKTIVKLFLTEHKAISLNKQMRIKTKELYRLYLHWVDFDELIAMDLPVEIVLSEDLFDHAVMHSFKCFKKEQIGGEWFYFGIGQIVKNTSHSNDCQKEDLFRVSVTLQCEEPEVMTIHADSDEEAENKVLSFLSMMKEIQNAAVPLVNVRRLIPRETGKS